LDQQIFEKRYSITACSGPAAWLRSAALVEPIMIASGNATYQFDIHLQGDNETVFFDYLSAKIRE
jgi:hypothetical protein